MNWRNVGLGAVAVFVLWSVLDFLIHGMLLGPLYSANPMLFRPMDQMLMPLLYATVLMSAFGYALLYGLNAPRPGMGDSLKFGLIFGLATGVGMGFGTLSVMPIPLEMACGWFLGALVESTLAALLLHWVFRPRAG